MKKCKECGQELPKEKQGVKIVSRYGLNKVLFQSTKTTLKEAVIEAVSKGANLRYANLRYADLSGANLRSADLRNANLRNANLRSADLRSANLRSANLKYANLSGANLRNANLRYANLRSADLSGAKTEMCRVNFTPEEYDQAKQFIEGLKL